MSLYTRFRAFIRRHSTPVIWMVPVVVLGIIINAVGSPLLVNVYTYFCVNLIDRCLGLLDGSWQLGAS